MTLWISSKSGPMKSLQLSDEIPRKQKRGNLSPRGPSKRESVDGDTISAHQINRPRFDGPDDSRRTGREPSKKVERYTSTTLHTRYTTRSEAHDFQSVLSSTWITEPTRRSWERSKRRSRETSVYSELRYNSVEFDRIYFICEKRRKTYNRIK